MTAPEYGFACKLRTIHGMPSAKRMSARFPKEQNHHVSKLGSRIAAHFAKVGLTTELPELHDQTPQAVQVYLRKEELDALRKVAARSRRSVAALVREAVRKVVLMPAAEGPIAIWDGEPKRSSLDHDSVHDEP